jgi:methyl-accepting chemotaxis protein
MFISKINESIKTRVVVYFVISVLVGCSVISLISFFVSKEAIISAKEDNLRAINDSKIIEVKKIFNNLRNSTKVLSLSKFIQDSVVSFESLAHGIGLNIESDSDLSSEYYNNLEKKYIPIYDEIIEQYDVRNFYIILNSGLIISQYKKDAFFGKNLINGSLKDSELALFFKSVHESSKTGSREVYLKDIKYSDKLKDSKGYLAIGIRSKFDRDGYKENDLMGYLIVEPDWEMINNISKFKAGLGETGEVYLIGTDSLLRTDTRNGSKFSESLKNKKKYNESVVSRFLKKDNVDSEMAERVNYLNENVLSISQKVSVSPNVTWFVFTEVTTKEAFASINRISIISVFVIAIVILGIFVIGRYLGNTISSPLTKLAQSATDISKGNMSEISENERNDEIGKCFNAMRHMVQVLKNVNTDLETIIVASNDGRLDERLDDSKYKGDYKKIISGINKIFDEILKPVNESVSVLKKMSKGDFSQRVEGVYKGDHAVIKNAINSTVDSLNIIIFNVRGAVLNVDQSSVQLFDASKNLSEGAQSQATSLEEITGSIAEISGQTTANAENASQARELSESVKSSAVDGNSYMTNMLKAMDQISESSQNISKIIKVIDEIAFQTNLLALNAAVEAARAGVHGKGFAVVADEVRNLAARSAQAAKETTELIEDSNVKVEHGAGIAAQTAKSLDEIVDGIGHVTDLVGEISNASNNQAQGVSQINQALNQVEHVTQKNASLSKDSERAAKDLTNESISLSEMISQFILLASKEVEVEDSSFHLKLASGDDGLSSGLQKTEKEKGQLAITKSEKFNDDDFGKY